MYGPQILNPYSCSLNLLRYETKGIQKHNGHTQRCSVLGHPSNRPQHTDARRQPERIAGRESTDTTLSNFFRKAMRGF